MKSYVSCVVCFVVVVLACSFTYADGVSVVEPRDDSAVQAAPVSNCNGACAARRQPVRQLLNSAVCAVNNTTAVVTVTTTTTVSKTCTSVCSRKPVRNAVDKTVKRIKGLKSSRCCNNCDCGCR